MGKTSPTKLPVREVLGGYAKVLEDARVAQHRERYPQLAALAALAGEEEPQAIGVNIADEMWNEVEDWWPIRVLRQAAKDGDIEGCKRVLALILLQLHVFLPNGVLVPFRWKRGRPNQTKRVYDAWVAKGRPATSWRVCDALAKTCYPEEHVLSRSDPALRKKLRDRVRATIVRHEIAAGATKSSPIS